MEQILGGVDQSGDFFLAENDRQAPLKVELLARHDSMHVDHRGRDLVHERSVVIRRFDSIALLRRFVASPRRCPASSLTRSSPGGSGSRLILAGEPPADECHG